MISTAQRNALLYTWRRITPTTAVSLPPQQINQTKRVLSPIGQTTTSINAPSFEVFNSCTPLKLPIKAARTAHAVFQQVMNSSLPFVLIGSKLLKKEDLIKNFGLAAATPIHDQTLLDKNARVILGEQHWSMIINKFFILGAVSSGKEFHLVEPDKLTPAEFLRKSGQDLTVLGQELLILRELCCKRVEIQMPCGEGKEICFLCPQERLTREKFKQIWVRINELLEKNKGNISLIPDLMKYAGLAAPQTSSK